LLNSLAGNKIVFRNSLEALKGSKFAIIIFLCLKKIIFKQTFIRQENLRNLFYASYSQFRAAYKETDP